MVRAKFTVVSKEELAATPTNMVNLTLRAVISQEEGSENATFWKYTPSGEITMRCVNEEASDQFQAGQEFYVDFTPAVAPEAGEPEEKSE